jgi:hypothetical protein
MGLTNPLALNLTSKIHVQVHVTSNFTKWEVYSISVSSTQGQVNDRVRLVIIERALRLSLTNFE